MPICPNKNDNIKKIQSMKRTEKKSKKQNGRQKKRKKIKTKT